MTTQTSKHYDWIDTVRVVTMLLVIIGHSTYTSIITKYGGMVHPVHEGASMTHYAINTITAFIYTFHMPLFMAISGACFSLGFNKVDSAKSLASKKIKRLIIPFFIATFIIAVPIKYLSGYFDNSENLLLDIFLGQVLLFGNSHLWFVISLFLCFMLFYFTYPLQKRFPILYWFSIILMSLGSSFIYWNISDGLGIYGVMKHFLFFSLGFYSMPWIEKLEPKLSYIICIFVGMILLFLSQLYGIFGHTFYLSIPIKMTLALAGCVAIIMLCKFLANHNFNNTKIFKLFDKYNYELYLYGDPINYALVALFFSIESFDIFCNGSHSFIAFILRIICNIIFALGVVWLFSMARKATSFSKKTYVKSLNS